jgi:hypothetical protein
MDDAHEQLKGCVLAHRTSEKQMKTPRVVAGFVLVMYANGRKYDVQSLQGDNSANSSGSINLYS